MGLREENGDPVGGEVVEIAQEPSLTKDSVVMKKVQGAGPSVAFWELFRYADGFDKFLIVAGTVGAVASGLSLPVLLVIQAKLLNSFGTLHGNELYKEACKVPLKRSTLSGNMRTVFKHLDPKFPAQTLGPTYP